jgi:hypothetical protein
MKRLAQGPEAEAAHALPGGYGVAAERPKKETLCGQPFHEIIGYFLGRYDLWHFEDQSVGLLHELPIRAEHLVVVGGLTVLVHQGSKR